MSRPVITWTDLQGRYRVTSPAYTDRAWRGWSEEDLLGLAWAQCKAVYNLPEDHPFFVVQHEAQSARVSFLGGVATRFINGVPNWVMDIAGLPKLKT